MKHYKLREGESVRKPVVKRDRLEIHVPVLFLCLLLAFLVWLYVVSISKISEEMPLTPETGATTETVPPEAEAAAESGPCAVALPETIAHG